MTLQERLLIAAYREYSEIFWASGFQRPSPDIVRSFRAWWAQIADADPGFDSREVRHEYERLFLEEYHRQEAESRQ